MTGRSLSFYSLLVTLNCKFIMMTSQKQEGARGRNDPSNKEEGTKQVLLRLIVNFNYLGHFFVIVVRGHKCCLFELHNCCGMCK